MSRASLAVVLVLALQTGALGQPALQIWDAQCFPDGTVVAATAELRLVILKDDHWQPLSAMTGVDRLWRSADGRIFAIDLDGGSRLAVQLAEEAGPFPRWTIPTDFGMIRFASLDGVDVVTHDHVYRLDPGGRLTKLGATPIGASREPLRFRAPEILVSGAKAVVCTGTSHLEEDDVIGSCREARGAYVYRVDFEDPFRFTDPFACGGAVISALSDWKRTGTGDTTQARAFATGALRGRTTGAALGGSACLDGKRALLVGKRDIRVVSVPSLRTLWRQKVASEIGAVAVCGGTRAVVIPGDDPFPVQVFNLPATR